MNARFRLPALRRSPGQLALELRSGRERGDVVLGWLTKIAVSMAVLGLFLFDAISVGTTYVTASDQASYAARQGSLTWQESHDAKATYAAAAQAALEQDPDNEIVPRSVRIDPDGTVHVAVTRDATTLLLHRIGPIKHWAHVEREAASHATIG